MIEVRQVVADDADEAWERVIGEPDVRGVEAGRFDFAGGWNVTVAVMEFVREDPLEGELRRRIAAALRSVGGVETAGKWIEKCGSSPELPPAMPWSGLRQKSWTTSPARHAPMPEAEGEHIRCPVAGCQRWGIPADLGVQLDRRRRHQHSLRYEAHRRRLRAATTCWLTRDNGGKINMVGRR